MILFECVFQRKFYKQLIHAVYACTAADEDDVTDWNLCGTPSRYPASDTSRNYPGSSTNNSFMQSMPVQQPMKTMSQIGISVEPLHVIQHQIPAETTQTSTLTSFSEFSMKMLENFYNYASSFGINQSQMTPQPNISWIPMTVLDKWFQNFKKKMAQDQNFWRK
ncbi:protein Hikeshi-like [Asterias rubens]|uniref:protein Hikeshi-like n=1 Tax=Asterias rubens TaxID=7604 RepID=UPI00145559F5|nr:protein Hikeshi-like [Asterias rubens]